MRMEEHQNDDYQMETIRVDKFAEVLRLETILAGNGELELSTINISRPGLQLAGYFDYFGTNRIQVMGNAEMYYYSQLTKEERCGRIAKIIHLGVPCFIIARNSEIPECLVETLKEHNMPLFRSHLDTSLLINELVIYLNLLLAPQTTLHGVLLDIYGVGVLLTGKSGIGKSETALELVKRGHRLVADDAVVVKKVQDRLVGTSSEMIRYFMEVRGIGIVDVRSIYGVSSVLHDKTISLVVEMEHWNDKHEYDRLGQARFKETILGISIPKLIIPITPGRNLPVIMEVAATNHRLRSYGYDAAQVLIERSLGTKL